MSLRIPRMDTSHAEEVLRLVSSVALGPSKNALSYFIPVIGAWMAGGFEMKRDDPSQEEIMPSRYKELILDEIGAMARSAGVRREISVYTSLSYLFSNYGGALSLTPAILIPHQLLFPQGRNCFTQESIQDQQNGDIWHFTDDETRFLIARQIYEVKRNEGLFRMGIKTALYTTLFFLYSQPLFWALKVFLGGVAVGFYLLYERMNESKSDRGGVAILSRRFNDARRAQRAAIGALEKLRRQNCFRREQQDSFCRYYVTAEGNNPIVDLAHPLLTTRLRNLA